MDYALYCDGLWITLNVYALKLQMAELVQCVSVCVSLNLERYNTSDMLPTSFLLSGTIDPSTLESHWLAIREETNATLPQ